MTTTANVLAIGTSWVLFALLAIGSASAQCPSANSKEPYALGVGNASISEIYRLDTGETRVVSRYKGGVVVEQTLYQGLIRTEHIDNGRRTLFVPKEDLKRWFPLKIGKNYRAEFEAQEPNGKQRLFRTEHKVVAKDRIIVGPCQYEVLKVEHSNRYGEGSLLFINTDWYAPSIRMILAREYKLSGGGTDIRKMDSIRLLNTGTRIEDKRAD